MLFGEDEGRGEPKELHHGVKIKIVFVNVDYSELAAGVSEYACWCTKKSQAIFAIMRKIAICRG